MAGQCWARGILPSRNIGMRCRGMAAATPTNGLTWPWKGPRQLLSSQIAANKKADLATLIGFLAGVLNIVSSERTIRYTNGFTRRTNGKSSAVRNVFCSPFATTATATDAIHRPTPHITKTRVNIILVLQMTMTSEIKPNLHVWISFGKIFIFLIACSPFGPLSMVWIISRFLGFNENTFF